ncbi:MAG: glucose/galactose MFS transporter, partial [Flavihumibacter sp.]|nr:glucose/galactose MFS transporter [Flavihumibacter sp.]
KSIVGTNVAADALSNLASPGVTGGVLVVVGEDYGEGANAATIVGYILGIIAIPKLINQVTALRICTLLGLLFAVLILLVKGNITLLGHTADLSIWFVVLLGLANSLVWAGIWPLALDGLGRFTKIGASLMIMGLCGNALMPLLYGWAADVWGQRLAYAVLIPCYLYLIFYAVRGHQLRNWRKV